MSSFTGLCPMTKSIFKNHKHKTFPHVTSSLVNVIAPAVISPDCSVVDAVLPRSQSAYQQHGTRQKLSNKMKGLGEKTIKTDKQSFHIVRLMLLQYFILT